LANLLSQPEMQRSGIWETEADAGGDTRTCPWKFDRLTHDLGGASVQHRARAGRYESGRGGSGVNAMILPGSMGPQSRLALLKAPLPHPLNARRRAWPGELASLELALTKVEC